MQDFLHKKIVLGICGGVAAYKAAFLVRELKQLGAEVKVVMTESAQEFISPLCLQALGASSVRSSLFDEEAERAMGHIELARWADVLLIAPASANCLAKMAQGLADCLLSTIYLVSKTPVLVCPAMNQSMWSHPATKENCAKLKQRGVIMIGPEEGSQACGEVGFGRMTEPEAIIDALRMYSVYNRLKDREVVITAGPTREKIDPVRYISNESSGKMGYALAKAAQMAGAKVRLISGPTDLARPKLTEFCSVTTAEEMHQAVMERLQPGCIFLGVAAVADYAVSNPAYEKIKKSDKSEWSLQLKPNPDILLQVGQTGKAAFLLGFAAETSDLIAAATEKMQRKKLDMLIANLVGNGLGFGQEDNQVTVLTLDGQQELPRMHKSRLAAEIIAIIAEKLHNHAE